MAQPIVREHPQRTISRLQRQVDQLRRQATEQPIERFDVEAAAALNQLREVVASLASEIIALRIESEGMRRAAGVAVVMDGEESKSEVLYGAAAIARFLGLAEKVVRHRIDQQLIPTFRIGGTVCARPARLREWLADQDKPDLLYGMKDIAEHLGLSERQAQHLHDTSRLPTYKIGRKICALRSKLDGWLDQQAGRAT